MSVTVTIDRDECILCGACWAECPDVYEESPDDGMSQVVEAFQVDDDPAEGEVPDDLEDCAISGADVCPVAIIQVG
jgi:ferredoxin